MARLPGCCVPARARGSGGGRLLARAVEAVNLMVSRRSRRVRLAALCGCAAALLTCGESAGPADPAGAAREPLSAAERQFVGTWTLAAIERRDADGQPTAPPLEDRLGVLVYDASGRMGVALQRPGAVPSPAPSPVTSAADEPTAADAALAQYERYTSYFGPFTVDEGARVVTHRVAGSLNPGLVNSDQTRAYTFDGDRLTLRPPPAADGSTTHLTWERQPDLPAAEVTDTHRRLFGAYRIASVARHTTDGYAVNVEQYETGYLFYTPAGHVSVHLMRPGRAPHADARPTADEALRLTATYRSSFGRFSVREMAGCITCPGPRDQGYLTHHRAGGVDAGDAGTEARRYYELTDTHLTLRPPVHPDDEGREVVTALRWERLPPR